MNETAEERTIRVAKLLTFLTSSSVSKRKRIAVEIKDHEDLFQPIKPLQVVINASTQQIISVIVNRLAVVDYLKTKYGLTDDYTIRRNPD